MAAMSSSSSSSSSISTTTTTTTTTTTVLFDIDGTLADSFQLGFDATQEVLAREGLPPITHADYHAHTIYPTPERLARHAFQLPTPRGVVEDGAAEALSLGKVASREDFQATAMRLGAAFDELYIGLVSTETACFYDGVGALLERLAATPAASTVPRPPPPLAAAAAATTTTTISASSPRVCLGALTNAAVAYAEAVLSVNGARSLFGSVHGADDVPKPKPHGDGLLVCVRDLFGPEEEGGERQQWKLDQCVYVGDSPSDGAAAKAAGMRSVGVSYGSHPLETVEPAFDQTVHSVEELEEALMKLVTGGASSASSSSSPAFDGLSCGAFKMQQLQGGEQQQRIQAFLASKAEAEG
jgi:phosphoglycolate phosphatase-like HAD superfamily hydrolase